MSNYSEISIPNQELLATGVGGNMPENTGAIIKMFLCESSFTGTPADMKTRSFIEAGIVAGTVHPFPMLQEINPQNVAAAYKEAGSGTSYKMKGEVRKTEYEFIGNIIQHSAIKSYADRSWNILYYTNKGYLIGHTKSVSSAGVVTAEGLKAARVYVNAYSTSTFADPSSTKVIIEDNNVDDLDKEFFIVQPDYDMTELQSPVQVDLIVTQATQAAGTLTVKFKLQERGSNANVSGALLANFKAENTSGVAITLTSVTESANVYTAVATNAATAGSISTNGVITVANYLYKSAKSNFVTA